MAAKHLSKFEELNTTTDSIHELGKYPVLIILEDGTNLTSWGGGCGRQRENPICQ